jgi:hypothetical protein
MAYIAQPTIDWTTPANKPQAQTALTDAETTPFPTPLNNGALAAPSSDTVIEDAGVGYT